MNYFGAKFCYFDDGNVVLYGYFYCGACSSLRFILSGKSLMSFPIIYVALSYFVNSFGTFLNNFIPPRLADTVGL